MRVFFATFPVRPTGMLLEYARRPSTVVCAIKISSTKQFFVIIYMRECVHFVGNFSGSHYRTSALSCTYMHSHQQTGTFRGCVCAVFIAYLLHKHTFVCSVCIYVCVAASVNYGCCCLPVTIVVTLPTRSNHPVFVQLAFLLCQPLWNSGSAPKFATASASK